MDGYEVCRRIREQPGHGVPARRHGDRQRRRAEDQGARGRGRRLPDQADQPERAAGPGRLAGADQAVPGHHQAPGDELAAWNQELESRVETQVSQLERMGRLRRFLSPQLAELIVDSGDESFLESHRREIVVVFCDLRGFTTFAEASEPEEVMGVLKEYHEALGDLIFRFEGTLERFAGDGLMVFFNDPVRCDDGPLRAVRMSVAMRTRVRGLAESWARQGHDLALGIGDRPGLRHAGQDRVRRPARLRGDRERHEPGIAAVRRGRALADPRHRAGLRGGRVAGRGGGRRLSRPARLQPESSTRSASRASTTRGPCHDRGPVDGTGRRRPTCSPPCPRRSGTGGSTSCRPGWPGSGTRCGSTTTTSRSSSFRRSRSTGPWGPAGA